MAQFTLKGTKATAQRIAAIGTRVERRIQGVMKAVADAQLTEMKTRTPVDRGPLRSSLHVTGPRRTATGQEVGWAAGGPSAPYARVQHEDTSLTHTVGQAKFIESVVFEQSTAMVSEIAAALRKVI